MAGIDWMGIASMGLGALGGVLGSDAAEDAAKAQVKSTEKQIDAARQFLRTQLQMTEPQRYTGYQALNDINTLYGYQSAPYTNLNQLANSQRLTPEQIQGALKHGFTPEQIMQMGSIGGWKEGQYAKLTDLGFTPEQIMQMRGINPASATPAAGGTAPQAGNMSRFFTSPDYTFRRDEGERGIGGSFAGRGMAKSGGALKALSEFNSNLASGEFGNYVGRLMQMAGMGTTANNQAGQAVQSANNTVTGAIGAAGDARASGIYGQANSIVNGLNTGLNTWMMGRYLNQQPTGQPTGSPYGFQYPFDSNPANYSLFGGRRP